MNSIGGDCREYLDRAQEYFSAVEILAPRLTADTIAPIGLLASHAIELGLKAYLLHIGRSERDLKKIGHDLRKAWGEAAKAGLRVDLVHTFSVDVLSLSHDDPFLFRYPKSKNAVAITEPAEVCSAVKAIIEAVANQIEKK
jgi:hypothetical protein